MPNLRFNKDSIFGTFVVIVAFCLVCSVCVSSAVVALAPLQAKAVATDRQINILKVAGYEVEGSVGDTYAKHIKSHLLDVATGEFVDDEEGQADSYNFVSLSRDPAASEAIPGDQDFGGIRVRTKLMPVYEVISDEGATERYILPFYGKGLMSTVYGYMAVQNDGRTIAAVTFYSHGETPGLGGEVDNPRWQALWNDKQLFTDNGDYVFKITKNAAHEGEDANYQVDALSGATNTSRGVNNAVHYWADVAYRPFLTKLSQGEVGNE